MKIIHCSDLHLDSPLRTHYSPAQAKERNEEILFTFHRIVEYAKENRVQAVLIAGDLFDGRRCQKKTVDFVMDTIASASGILFYYIKGNHDESTLAFIGRVLPDNLIVFGSRWETYEAKNLTISGISPEDWSDSLYDALHLPEDKLNIVMMHGQTGTLAGEEQICLPQLRGKHISYLALGHLHSYEQASLEPGCNYCYCGCPEGRGFDECGEKGFVLLDTDEYGIHTRFVPFAKRQLYELSVNVTGLRTHSEIRDALLKAGEGIEDRHLVRFVLLGSTDLRTSIDPDFLKRSLEGRWSLVEVKDQTVLSVNKEEYEYDISLKGAFLRSVYGSELSCEDRDRVIRYGFAALGGEDIL